MNSVKELKAEAKKKGIKRYYEMRKPQLILVLSDSSAVEQVLEKMKKAATCEHNRLKIYCSICCGSKFCVHKKRKDFCRKCSADKFCIHDRLKYFCVLCDGKYICCHKRIKHQCKECKLNANEKYKNQQSPQL